MFEIRKYTDADKEVWNAYVAQDRFHDHSLMIFRNDKLYALLPANEDGDIFYSHQGLTYAGLLTNGHASTDNICQVFVAINTYLKKAGFRKCIYKPIPWIYQQQKWYNIRKSGARKALEKGIFIEESEDYETFWSILTENLMNTYQAHPVHTLQEMSRLKTSFPDNIKLYVAREESGKMLGGTVLYISRKVVHTQYISASEEGKKAHALDALFQNLIKIKYKDFDYFDFGTSNEEGGKILNTSLIYQKEGFGGRGVVYDTYEWTL